MYQNFPMRKLEQLYGTVGVSRVGNPSIFAVYCEQRSQFGELSRNDSVHALDIPLFSVVENAVYDLIQRWIDLLHKN